MPGGTSVLRWSAAGAALCAGLVLSTSAHAGAFAVREQSSYYQGMSFAGAAAGDDLSSMFWNSAAAAAAPGINVSANAAVVVPHTEIEAEGGALLAQVPGTDSGDIGDPTFIPATYANYQLSKDWFLGLALNSQYGFSTKPDNPDFAGTPLATTSRIFSVTANPNLAYKATPELTLGVGVQVLYADVRLTSSNTTTVPVNGIPTQVDGRQVDADDWAFGATAGLIWEPTSETSMGVGYRSAIDVEAEGACQGAGLSTIKAQTQFGTPQPGFTCDGGVSASLILPELVTASFSHQVDERFRLLGTVEWANWSRVNKRALFKDDSGNVVDVFDLDYDDGWFFSGGVEYAWRPDTILRAGVGYEISPISDEARQVSLPDNDRLWVSAGFSTKISESTKLDFGYSHLFIEDAPIETMNSAGAVLFEGEGTGDIDIVTLGLTHNFGGPEPELEPLK